MESQWNVKKTLIGPTVRGTIRPTVRPTVCLFDRPSDRPSTVRPTVLPTRFQQTVLSSACDAVLSFWTQVDKLGNFLLKIRALRVGVDFAPLREEWESLVVDHDVAMNVVRQRRLTLEDHKDDVKKDKQKIAKGIFRSKDKFRSQYQVGACVRALQFLCVDMSNCYGKGRGIFPDSRSEDLNCSSHSWSPMSGQK